MNRRSLHYFLSTLGVLCISLISVHQAKSQENEIFEGPYYFANQSGFAEFTYIPGKKDQKIKNGMFSFRTFSADTLSYNTFYKLEAAGKYELGLKSGLWNYTTGIHRVEITDVSNFNVNTNLASEQTELVARYDSLGIPSGNWNYAVLTFSDEKKSTLFSSNTIRFQNGRITGLFDLRSSDQNYYLGLKTVKGYATENGLMDSIWHIEYMRDTLQISEYRNYQEGFLTDVVKINGATGDTLINISFDETKDKLRIIRGGSTALFSISKRDFGVYYTDGFDTEHRNALTQLHANAHIFRIIDDLTAYDDGLYFDDNKQFEFALRTKRFEFKLLPAEDSLVSIIARSYPSLIKKVDTLMNYNSFAFNQQRTDSLYRARNYLNIIDSLLHRLEYIMTKAGSDQVKYFDLQAYQSTNGFGFMHIDSAAFQWNEKTLYIDKDFNLGVDPERNLLYRLVHYLDQMGDEVDSLANSVSAQLGRLHIGDELESLETEILTRRKEAIRRYAAYKAQSEEETIFFENMVNRFFRETYEAFIDSYNKDNIEDDRLTKARKYLELLNAIDGYHQTFQRIFANQRNIKKLYIEEVFNPFTFTTYDRLLKEPIYKNGMKVFSHYIDIIGSTGDISTIDNTLQKILALQVRLGELKDEDTRSLERTLRSTKGIDAIITQFGLEL